MPSCISQVVVHYLHLNIQNANPPTSRHGLHGLYTRAVEVAAKLRILDETPFIDKLRERLLVGEVVLATIFFAGPGCARSMRDGKAKMAGVRFEQPFEERRLAGAGGS